MNLADIERASLRCDATGAARKIVVNRCDPDSAVYKGVWIPCWGSGPTGVTLTSYGGEMEMIPQSHIEFVQSMHRYWQNETHIFVHANVEPDVALEDQLDVWLRWQANQQGIIRGPLPLREIGRPFCSAFL